MKIIFLDNDGVICLATEFGGRDKKVVDYFRKNRFAADVPVECRFDNFNVKAVRVLNSILLETGADIVISSDWKCHATLEELQSLYIEYGVIKIPIDTTPSLYESGTPITKEYLEDLRIREINQWLSEHKDIDNWVAVDDLDLSLKFRAPYGINGVRNFVHTPRKMEGIKQLGVRENIIKFLI